MNTVLQRAALTAALVSAPFALAFQPAAPAPTVEAGRAGRDAAALVAFGPRVAGTGVMERASAYLVTEYKKAGYQAEVRTFNYPKFEDRGSSLTVGGTPVAGSALQGSVAGKPGGRLVAVPGVGRAEDFARVEVRGAVAIVLRGEITFLEKARNALAAGATGLVIVNSEGWGSSQDLSAYTSAGFFGTLGGEVDLPVLAVSNQTGAPLMEQANRERLNANLSVDTRRYQATGRNVVAFVAGSTRPALVIGGHYDSVPGSPGANDNASGTAVVLEMARAMAGTPQARQTWFVAFDGEEDGLKGSAAFVKAASPEFLKGLKGMLNFDMVGVNERLLLGGSPEVMEVAKGVAPLGATRADGGSDHASFASANVPYGFFYRGQEPNYHLPSDRSVDARLLDQTAKDGLEVARRLLAAPAAS